MFRNRVEAGERLALRLAEYEGRDAVVLGIPRGGVVVAAKVAEKLGLPLDIVATAKVGAPGNPEYAAGAVAADGEVLANERGGFSAEQTRAIAGPALEKVQREIARFREGRPALALSGRTVIVVDDGIATGLTARAAVEYVRRQGPLRIVLAVPVIAPEAFRALAPLVDALIVEETPSSFWAVGEFYQVFGQTEDAEVEALLREARMRDDPDA